MEPEFSILDSTVVGMCSVQIEGSSDLRSVCVSGGKDDDIVQSRVSIGGYHLIPRNNPEPKRKGESRWVRSRHSIGRNHVGEFIHVSEV